MLQIGSRLLDGSYDCIGKDDVREVLRVLGLQRHIERWLQILHRVTGVQPPCPGPLILQQLDTLFEELQRPHPPISKVSPSLSKRNHIETLEILLAAEV